MGEDGYRGRGADPRMQETEFGIPIAGEQLLNHRGTLKFGERGEK